MKSWVSIVFILLTFFAKASDDNQECFKVPEGVGSTVQVLLCVDPPPVRIKKHYSERHCATGSWFRNSQYALRAKCVDGRWLWF